MQIIKKDNEINWKMLLINKIATIRIVKKIIIPIMIFILNNLNYNLN